MLARGRPVGAATISDSIAARNYTICNLCTVASFGHNAPRKHALFLHWQFCVFVDVLSVFGCLMHFAFCIQLECASE